MNKNKFEINNDLVITGKIGSHIGEFTGTINIKDLAKEVTRQQEKDKLNRMRAQGAR